MVDAENVFNPKDFESIRLLVDFTNLTTRTEIKAITRKGISKDQAVSLSEIFGSTLVLELPDKSCNLQHSAMVRISKAPTKSENTDKPTELLSVTGKIVGLEEVGEAKIRITLECLQYDDKSWNNLLAIFATRQQEIEQFLKAVRGY